ncbi:hypothetical protein B0H67DRAFT_550884 [Lasiosphaeris hirsuta]|uniref:Uncharacterized protein n=1 Tax=Lasiosphaeris hirsuta TaxID=260670 RepID=A0AA40B075_9PEZI|nr:hypothetical protein B0H67DRAFT_550884 [Lasiosphaeris hirsuta]
MIPIKISDRPDTFADFDIVVSISEETFNGQLFKLYGTKLTQERLVPPSKAKCLKPLPASKHLINRHLSLHLINKKASTPEKIVYRNMGIEDFIHCPKVRTRPEEYDPVIGNAVDKYKKAYLEIKFRKDIENVLKDIIQPARDPSNPAATNGKVTEKLNKYIDSQISTVSTIFSQTNPRVYTQRYEAPSHPVFGDMTDEWKDNNGTPYATAENPFILGYGISKKKVAIGEIGGPGMSTASMPDYFQPKQVAMSATPGEVKPERMCTSGPLKYCLLTHRDSAEGHQPVDIDEADTNAGIITKNFFDVTKTMGRTTDPQGSTQGNDGIMAFSKAIFPGLRLQSLKQSLLLDPSSVDYNDMIAKGLRKEDKDVTITLGDWKSPTATGNGWELKRSWKTSMMSPPADISLLLGPGDERIIFFDIEFENMWDYVTQHKNWFVHLVDGYEPGNKWLKERLRGFTESDFMAIGKTDFYCAVSLRTKSLVRVVMNSDVVGTWGVDVTEEGSKNLLKKNTSVTWTTGSVDSTEYGNFQQLKNFPNYSFTPDSEIIKGALAGWGTSAKDIIGDEVVKAFQGLTKTVIMPAGDVFAFAGLDTGDLGHLYAQVNFVNDGGFELVKGTIA